MASVNSPIVPSFPAAALDIDEIKHNRPQMIGFITPSSENNFECLARVNGGGAIADVYNNKSKTRGFARRPVLWRVIPIVVIATVEVEARV
jgi:hypothetical protein